jgi:hypothetical protein
MGQAESATRFAPWPMAKPSHGPWTRMGELQCAENNHRETSARAERRRRECRGCSGNAEVTASSFALDDNHSSRRRREAAASTWRSTSRCPSSPTTALGPGAVYRSSSEATRCRVTAYVGSKRARLGLTRMLSFSGPFGPRCCNATHAITPRRPARQSHSGSRGVNTARARRPRSAHTPGRAVA